MDRDYDFVIVGGGMAADAAARGIREQGSEGSIAIVGEEPDAPFPRPALSKKLWTEPSFGFDDAALGTSAETGATIHLDSRVTGIDTDAHRVTTARGDSFGYGRLLVATGGHPRQVDGLAPGPRVLYYRTLRDYQRLRALADDRPRVAVVGGGYIGSEIAAALVQQECSVTLLHPDDVLGASMFPRSVAEPYQALFTDAGVDVQGGIRVEGGEVSEEHVALRLSDGSSLEVDVVVLGLGIEPAGAVLPSAEHSDDGGIVVDEHLATSVDDVFAAGDVAEYPDRILGRRRVEHVDNATTMGRAAGRIMAGSTETYDHTPMFYSDLFEHGYEAVGTIDASLETFVDDIPDEGGTVVYYLDDDAVRGVLLWDCDGGMDAARDLLARHERPADPDDLVGAVRCT